MCVQTHAGHSFQMYGASPDETQVCKFPTLAKISPIITTIQSQGLYPQERAKVQEIKLHLIL